jgi:hypothetical protein
MNSDFSRAYAVQGDANSPFKKFAEVPTEIGVGTSIESSSFQWQQAAAHDASQQVAASQSMAQPTIEGPTHGR